VDNWNGPTGIVSAVGKGIFHTIMCNEESIADFVPVDMVNVLMICDFSCDFFFNYKT
jgi:hypothetical protein